MLVVTSILYFVKTFSDRRERPVKNRAYDRLETSFNGTPTIGGQVGAQKIVIL